MKKNGSYGKIHSGEYQAKVLNFLKTIYYGGNIRMRKILSLILVAAMFVSMIILPAGAAEAKIEDENAKVVANYFDGTLEYCAAPGEEPIAVKAGGASKITIDGHIDDGEWGNNVIHVDSKFAANNQNAVGKWLTDKMNDAMFNHPSAENTYFYQAEDAAIDGSLSYDLYLLWDDDYLYLAARVDDPYNHRAGKTTYSTDGTPEFWMGDSLQFMVDTDGPNSASRAVDQKYSYYVEHNIKHDTSKGPDVVTFNNRPWAGDVIKEGTNNAKYRAVPSFVVTTNKSGEVSACDSSHRYTPHIDEAKPDNGTVWDWSYLNNGGENGYDTMTGYWYEQGVASYLGALPVNYGEKNNPDYVTDYEVAIPWEMITRTNEDGTFKDKFAPQIGTELGMSVVVFNSSLGSSTKGGFESWLGWGSGICNSQTDYDYQTAGGSNQVTLSGTNYKDDAGCVHTFAEATCMAAETCTKCGYQRGFETGHDFVTTNDVLPTGEVNGGATAVCSTCGAVENLVFEANKADTAYQSFYETDEAISGAFSSGWTANWYDTTDDITTEAHEGKMLYYKDTDGSLKAKTAFDKSTFGYSVADCATNGEGLFYADGTPATIQPDVNFTTQTGTYFDSDSITGENFTYKIDVYPTSYSEEGALGYVNGLYNWFGKRNADYMAGLFVFNGHTDSPRYLFAIASTELCNTLKNDIDAFMAKCEVYKEVDYSVVEANKWHQHVFFFDDSASYAALYWDGELMVSAHNPQFKYVKPMADSSRYALYRRMEIPFYAKNIEVGNSSLASHYISTGSGYTVTVNGNEETHAKGETVEITASRGTFYVEGANSYRFVGWTAEGVTLTDANSATTTFTMPENDVTVTENYVVIGDTDLDGRITARDSLYLKKMIVGIFAQVPAADINLDGKVNAYDSLMLRNMLSGKYSPTK